MKPSLLSDASLFRCLLAFVMLYCASVSLAQEAPAPAVATAPEQPAAAAPAVEPPPALAPVPSPAAPAAAASIPSPAPAPAAIPAPSPAPVPPVTQLPPTAAPLPTSPLATAPVPNLPVARTFQDSGSTEYQNVRVQLSGTQETQSIADPFHLQAKITNRTGEDITVSQVRWELARSIVATRPQQETTRDGGRVPWFQGTEVPSSTVLPNGSEQLFDLTMPDIHENWWTLPRNVRLMAFKPGEYPVKVRVEYAVGPQRRTSVAEETIRVRFDTTPWFYVWGGIIGSMIGVLFEFFYTTARKLDRFEWPRDDRGRIAPGYAIRDSIAFLFRWVLGGTAKWLTGSLTAAIVLLFLYYYKDVQLPITIQINDFFGAVVVGLVAHRLGLWVYETLFARAEKPPGTGGQGGSGVDQFRFPQQVVPALTYPER